MDADNLSPAEKIAAAREKALASAEASFNQLDLNGDGEVDKQEVKKLAMEGGTVAGADEAKIKEFFETFDTDGDGKI